MTEHTYLDPDERVDKLLRENKGLKERLRRADHILKVWDGVEWKENDGQYDWIVLPQDFDPEHPPQPPEEKP
jgi:hypothetical protein